MSCKQNNITYWVCAVLLFIISFPKFIWVFGPNIMLFASYFFLFFAIKDIFANKIHKLSYVALFLQILFLWTYYVIEVTNFSGRIMALIMGFGFAPIFLASFNFWKECIDRFIKLLAVLLILAIVEHVLISYFNVYSHYTIIPECPINPGRSYYNFVFNIYIDYTFSFFNRFYAFYDEPGVLGNLTMVLLYIQKFDLKKWYNVVLLIAGLMSYSLAFYIALILYFIIFGTKRTRIVFIIVAALFTYFLYGNEFANRYIFGRMILENGKMAGYNREKVGFDLFFDTLHIKDYFWMGYYPRSRIEYAASWKWAFTLYGIIPSILYVLSIIFSRITSTTNKGYILRGIILVIIIWIQRPFIHLYLYALLLALPFIYFGSMRKNRQQCINRTNI